MKITIVTGLFAKWYVNVDSRHKKKQDTKSCFFYLLLNELVIKISQINLSLCYFNNITTIPCRKVIGSYNLCYL